MPTSVFWPCSTAQFVSSVRFCTLPRIGRSGQHVLLLCRLRSAAPSIFAQAWELAGPELRMLQRPLVLAADCRYLVALDIFMDLLRNARNKDISRCCDSVKGAACVCELGIEGLDSAE